MPPVRQRERVALIQQGNTDGVAFFCGERKAVGETHVGVINFAFDQLFTPTSYRAHGSPLAASLRVSPAAGSTCAIDVLPERPAQPALA